VKLPMIAAEVVVVAAPANGGIVDPVVRQNAEDWLRETYFVAALARLVAGSEPLSMGGRAQDLEAFARALDDARALLRERLGIAPVKRIRAVIDETVRSR
jgi:hypothetical protein